MSSLLLHLSKMVLVNSTSRSQPFILKSRAFCVKCPKPGKCDKKVCNDQLDPAKKKCGCSGILSTPGCPSKQYEWNGCKTEDSKEDSKDCSRKSKNAKIRKLDNSNLQLKFYF